MTSDHNHSGQHLRRCQAVTVKGTRCHNEASLYRIHEDNGLEYLCCKLHFQNFRAHPGQQGQQPSREAW